MKCTSCGKDSPDDSTFCAHCGKKFDQVKAEAKKTNRLAVYGLIILVVLLVVVWTSISTEYKAEGREEALRGALSYLVADVAEVKWVEFEANNAYVGFDPLPDDWQSVIRAAAMRGNRAMDFGCHVWAVDANQRGWRPGAGPYYGEVTARYGQIE